MVIRREIPLQPWPLRAKSPRPRRCCRRHWNNRALPAAARTLPRVLAIKMAKREMAPAIFQNSEPNEIFQTPTFPQRHGAHHGDDRDCGFFHDGGITLV